MRNSSCSITLLRGSFTILTRRVVALCNPVGEYALKVLGIFIGGTAPFRVLRLLDRQLIAPILYSAIWGMNRGMINSVRKGFVIQREQCSTTLV